MFQVIFYKPLFNALVFLIDVIPGGDVGIAVILLTILVKVLLLPLNKKAILNQIKLKEIEPEINEIKEKYKEDKQEQARKTFELYKEKKINPVSGCLPVIIQIPIIIALYQVFLKGFDFNPELIYPFLNLPEVFSISLFGLISLSEKSLLLAILAGVSQFFQARLSTKRVSQNSIKLPGGQPNMSEIMNFQVKYVLPLFIIFIAYRISGAIALYWTVNNIFNIGQELIIRKKLVKNYHGGQDQKSN